MGEKFQSSQRYVSKEGISPILTSYGAKIHNLVRTDHVLRMCSSPKINFEMSPGLVRQYQDKRTQLIAELHLPEDEIRIRRSINRYRVRLEKYGFPFWKQLDGRSGIRGTVDRS